VEFVDMQRRVLIDTDTASDDAVAIIMALRSPLIEVVAITVVAGNQKRSLCRRVVRVGCSRLQGREPSIAA